MMYRIALTISLALFKLFVILFIYFHVTVKKRRINNDEKKIKSVKSQFYVVYNIVLYDIVIVYS